MSLQAIFPFTTPDNYERDSDKIDITGGVAKLKDQRDSNISIFDAFNKSNEASWAKNGITKTRTLQGGAVVLNGKADLTSGLTDAIQYNSENLVNAQKFSICLKFLPNYTDDPANDVNFVIVGNGINNNNKTIIKQDTASAFRFTLYSDNGSLRWTDVGMGTFQFTAGEEYKIILKFNFEAGSENQSIYIYDDTGSLVYSHNTNARACEKSDSLTACPVITFGNPSNHYIDRIAVQPDFEMDIDFDIDSLSETLFSTDNPIIKPYMAIYMNELESGEEIVNKSGLDDIKYNVEISGIWYWINESGLVVPVTVDDYSQSNTVIEWNNALNQWDPPQAVYVRFRAFLHSEDGYTTPELDNMILNYIYRGDPPDTIHKTLLWGKSFDGSGNPTTGITVKVTPAAQVQEYKTNTIILESELTAVCDAEGYWWLYLVESDNLSNGYYIIELNGMSYKFKIPEQQKICINNLILERV